MKTVIALACSVLLCSCEIHAQTNRPASADLAYNPQAQFELGKTLLKNEPGKIHEGLALLKKSAGAGNTNAMLELGRFYREMDVKESLSWYRLAMTRGNPEGAYYVGDIVSTTQIARGDLRPKKARDAEAAQCFEIAARAGYKPAMHRLMLIYRYGGPGLKNNKRAMELSLLAGDYLNASSIASEDGDLVKAYAYHKVELFVSQKPTDGLRSVAVKMTPEQVKQGDAMAAELISKKKLTPGRRD